MKSLLMKGLIKFLVSSQQMHKIRKSLRGEGEVQGVVLMGKNTMVGPNWKSKIWDGL